jgi:hypothetical protein
MAEREFIPPIEDCYGSRRINDGAVWLREDKVKEALQKALSIAIRNHIKFLGNDAKSICWDVREEFEKAIENG